MIALTKGQLLVALLAKFPLVRAIDGNVVGKPNDAIWSNKLSMVNTYPAYTWHTSDNHVLGIERELYVWLVDQGWNAIRQENGCLFVPIENQ